MPNTIVSITGGDFLVNGNKTYAGRIYDRMRIEGLLFNSRMVQAAFDDLNPETRSLWDYPDGRWDPERNTREFVTAMPEWRRHGLLGFTINLQGGSPRGYSQGEAQPWINSAFDEVGCLRIDYMSRFVQILDKADELGMVPILGLFYYGQDQHLADETAVLRACDNITDWLLDRHYANVLIEINNQADIADLDAQQHYHHDVLHPGRVDGLIRRVQERSEGRVSSPIGRLLVSTSFWALPSEAAIGASDFILLHGNNIKPSGELRRLVERCRTSRAYSGQPIVFNEDDHTDFNSLDNHLLAAIREHASWGFFDYRREGEDFGAGYQSMPTSWGINTPRKRAFFDFLKEITGS